MAYNQSMAYNGAHIIHIAQSSFNLTYDDYMHNWPLVLLIARLSTADNERDERWQVLARDKRVCLREPGSYSCALHSHVFFNALWS